MSTKTKKKLTLPKGLPPLPPVPKGYDAWEYRGIGWGGRTQYYACIIDGVAPFINEGQALGESRTHYFEAIKRPAPAKKQPKAKAVKAHKMFANYFEGNPQTVVTANKTMGCTVPVAVLDISNPDALVEQVCNSLMSEWNTPLSDEESRIAYSHDARVILESLGIIPKRKGAK